MHSFRLKVRDSALRILARYLIVPIFFTPFFQIGEGMCEDKALPVENQGLQFGGLHSRLHNFVISGMKWHRYDLPWQAVERSKGEFNFEQMDKAINEMVNNGIRILGILEYPPCWAIDKPEGHPDPDCGHFPPKDLRDWENYVYNMVSHFKDRVKHWEIWNEPNVGFLHASPEQYSEILKVAYVTAKRADRDCKIAACSTAGIDISFVKIRQSCASPSAASVSWRPFSKKAISVSLT